MWLLGFIQCRFQHPFSQFAVISKGAQYISPCYPHGPETALLSHTAFADSLNCTHLSPGVQVVILPVFILLVFIAV